MNHKKRWLILAPLGLSIFGMGACLIAEAAMCKFRGEAWVLYGTIALIVLNSGLCIFGQSIIHKIKSEA